MRYIRKNFFYIKLILINSIQLIIKKANYFFNSLLELEKVELNLLLLVKILIQRLHSLTKKQLIKQFLKYTIQKILLVSFLLECKTHNSVFFYKFPVFDKKISSELFKGIEQLTKQLD